MDIDDDMGIPPFRLPGNMSASELEYVRQWFDHYLDKCDAVVAFLTEYSEQCAQEGDTGEPAKS